LRRRRLPVERAERCGIAILDVAHLVDGEPGGAGAGCVRGGLWVGCFAAEGRGQAREDEDLLDVCVFVPFAEGGGREGGGVGYAGGDPEDAFCHVLGGGLECRWDAEKWVMVFLGGNTGWI